MNTDNAGAKWTPEEERRLIESYAKGFDLPFLCRDHKRTSGGIRSRLAKLLKTYSEELLFNSEKYPTLVATAIEWLNNDENLLKRSWTPEEEKNLVERLSSTFNMRGLPRYRNKATAWLNNNRNSLETTSRKDGIWPFKPCPIKWSYEIFREAQEKTLKSRGAGSTIRDQIMKLQTSSIYGNYENPPVPNKLTKFGADLTNSKDTTAINFIWQDLQDIKINLHLTEENEMSTKPATINVRVEYNNRILDSIEEVIDAIRTEQNKLDYFDNLKSTSEVISGRVEKIRENVERLNKLLDEHYS